MIDDLRAIAIFAKVAEAGSFSAAGRALQLSTSVVSHHVKALETRHAVSLFHRSTRALSLTNEGKNLLQSANRMVEAAEEGLDAIADVSADPAGALRLILPAFLTGSPQERAIWDFARRYPNVAITLSPVSYMANWQRLGRLWMVGLCTSAPQARAIQSSGAFRSRYSLRRSKSSRAGVRPVSSRSSLIICA